MFKLSSKKIIEMLPSNWFIFNHLWATGSFLRGKFCLESGSQLLALRTKSYFKATQDCKVIFFFLPYWIGLLLAYLFKHLKKTMHWARRFLLVYGSLKLFGLTTALMCNHFIVYDLGVRTSHCFYSQQKLVQRVVLFSSSLWESRIPVIMCVCELLWIWFTDRWSMFITNKKLYV